MEPSLWADARTNEVILHVRLQPRARREGIVGVVGQRLKLCVTAPPEAGRANAAVLTMIARLTEVSATAVTIVRGASSRDKTIRIAAAEPGRRSSAGFVAPSALARRPEAL